MFKYNGFSKYTFSLNFIITSMHAIRVRLCFIYQSSITPVIRVRLCFIYQSSIYCVFMKEIYTIDKLMEHI